MSDIIDLKVLSTIGLWGTMNSSTPHMNKLSFSTLILLVFIRLSPSVAEERASLNAQEYDCREYVRECLSYSAENRADCFTSPSLQQTCISSPLKNLIEIRAAAENQLLDRKCLRTIDGEMLGLLSKESYSRAEVQSLEERIPLCKKNISEELLKP